MSVSYVLKEIVNSARPSPKSRLSNPVELDEFNLTECPFNEAQGIRMVLDQHISGKPNRPFGFEVALDLGLGL